jgi:hypothetical protein
MNLQDGSANWTHLAEKVNVLFVWKRGMGIGTLTCRDDYKNGWSGLDGPDVAKQALGALVDAGWIRELRNEPNSFGGRPSVRYQVNPRLWSDNQTAK